MNKWVSAARLRTLPLSISGIIMGTWLAYHQNAFSLLLLFLALLTTVLLQVLSNFANDYGDGVKGTDSHRTGEKRAVASGEISAQKMKSAVKLFAGLAITSAVVLLAVAYLPTHPITFAIYIALGVLSVWAAINYTVGKKAYGYRRLGDLFVFLFFGWVAVIGSAMLYTKQFDPLHLLPASAIGLLATAVLNLNNMRDIPQDRRGNKMTIAVTLGLFYSKFYHFILVFLPFILTAIYSYKSYGWQLEKFAYLILLIPAIIIYTRIANIREYAELDAELKIQALFTLAFAIITGYFL
ncbi:MAG: 1,4-dihydroxy-2-naphthoate octaprenyltransferase [Weeksellaceae bacterium]|nr:1,4-dihydroxy-2-naphthoate octaprenyltransferase [Weeksellaceae bacterium]